MNSNAPFSVDRDDRLAEARDAYRAAHEAGTPLDVDEFLARYPELAGELRECLASLAFIRRAGNLSVAGDTPAEGEGAGGVLGDFRILREVGRGGMGVVYEAEQVSLWRRVALKVLLFAATMDPRHLQRFHNEAQAAACLHHTNIVPVFSVGNERGVHFYAMQFIDGQPLSEIIRQLGRLEKNAPAGEEQTVAYQPAPDEAVATPMPGAAMTPLTGEGSRSRDYYRKLAELGIQAAEALDHAHQLGIVHRDIKPANLLLDGRGNVWVTDFGLAHVQHGEASLTGTGQMVGTPRYMSPEQALAKRVPIDHRTDVYSLGATLYELLTLRPAFASEDRRELLRQIAFEEPAKPRRLERAIPAELETIVLKAMEKRSQDRYATAQELADDLERWLKHEPIRARRPTLLQRATKWVRRHKPAAAASAIVLLMALILAGYITWTHHDRTLRRAANAQVILAALKDSQKWQEKRRLPEALSAVRQANGLLDGAEVDDTLCQRVRARLADLELLDKLDNIRMEKAIEVKYGQYILGDIDALYGQAFREAGLDVEALSVHEAGEQIHRSTVAEELAATLDFWAIICRAKRGMDDPSWKHLLGVARIAYPDARWLRLRQMLERRDRQALRELIASEEVFQLSPAVLSLLGVILQKETESVGTVDAFLREAQRRHPDDFLLNCSLWQFLSSQQPNEYEEIIRFAAIMVALRPDNPGAHLNLGGALRHKGRLEEAIAEYREAIRLKNDYADAHADLGSILREKGQLEEAISELREAIRLNKDDALPHNDLGVALVTEGQVDEAIAEYREAIRLKMGYALAHKNLGAALVGKGELDEAITELREAIRLKKDDADAHSFLGNVLENKGQLDEAIAEYREAIRINKDHAAAHVNLGNALQSKGRVDDAIAECREAIRINKGSPEAYSNLSSALRMNGQLEEAIAAAREAILLNKDHANAHCNLGIAVAMKGQLDEAISEFRETIRIKKDHSAAHANLRTALALKENLSNLPAILSGKAKVDNPAELLALAWDCQQPYKRRYAAAIRFYVDAFAAQPRLADDLNAQRRYNAACAAALAGCGQGKDADKLDPKERARLRQQALDWLRADLNAYRQVLEKSADKAGPVIAQQMQHWLQDGDFAGVRSDEALSKLPAVERSAWRKLWADVAELLAKAQGKAPAEKKSNSKSPPCDHKGA